MEVNVIPKRWIEVLKALRDNGFPEAMIAGGALRDLDNGRDIKDIDIFVKSKPDVLSHLEKAFGYPVSDIIAEQLKDYENGTTGVTDVYNFKHEPDVEYLTTDPSMAEFPGINHSINCQVKQKLPEFQIIVIDSPVTDERFARFLMADFDIGLCALYYNLEMGFVMTSSYIKDKHNKTLTYRFDKPDSRSQKRTIDRVARISDKYPDFKVTYDGPCTIKNEPWIAEEAF